MLSRKFESVCDRACSLEIHIQHCCRVSDLAPEDRILLMGVSRFPWDCDQRLLQSVYQKIVVIPQLDYCSRYAIWSSILKSYPIVGFDISLVTRISDGYTAGKLKKLLKVHIKI